MLQRNMSVEPVPYRSSVVGCPPRVLTRGGPLGAADDSPGRSIVVPDIPLMAAETESAISYFWAMHGPAFSAVNFTMRQSVCLVILAHGSVLAANSFRLGTCSLTSSTRRRRRVGASVNRQ